MLNKYNLTPTLFLLGGLSLVFVLAIEARQADYNRIALETGITGEQVKLRLEACIDSRESLVNSLATTEWRNQQAILQNWNSSASVLTNIFSGVQALNYIDLDWVIRVVEPLDGNNAALNQDLHAHPNQSVIDSLGIAETTSALVRTGPVDLLQGGIGFAFYQKIVTESNETLGFVNGVFRISDLMAACLSEERLQDRFIFALYEQDGKLIYEQSAADLALIVAPYQSNFEVDIASQPWQLAFAPAPDFLNDYTSVINDVLLGLGALLVICLAYATYLLLQKQKSLEESQRVYRLLVENQSDMVVKVNLEGEFLYVSPSYCKFFGRSEGELIGNQFLPMVHEDDRASTMASLERLKSPPHTSYHEQRALTSDGWRWLAWSNTGVLNAKGEIEAITAVGRDVTNIKNMEERISHTQKMQAVGELAGGITHDFNNLLQVMLSNVEFLQISREKDAELCKQLDQVKQVVGRAIDLTEKLSMLSRYTGGQKSPLEITTFTEEVISLFEKALPVGLKLSIEHCNETMFVNAVKTQLEQVILNLCFNARDALISTGGQISISLNKVMLDSAFCEFHPDISPGEYCCLRVKDNGSGIDESILPRIFDPFFTTKSADMGTGLGLANSYSIVKQHNGLILCQSEKSKGSVFSVYLPLINTPSETENQSSKIERKIPIGAGKLVLLVDDNQGILDTTSRALRNADFKVLTANNGKEAVQVFDKHAAEIAIVIMDLKMPVMDGKAAAKKILEISPAMNIVFMSGFIPESISKAGELPGVLIKKPFSGDTLLDILFEHFG